MPGDEDMPTPDGNKKRELLTLKYLILVVTNQFALMKNMGTEATQSGRINATKPTIYLIFRFSINDTKIIVLHYCTSHCIKQLVHPPESWLLIIKGLRSSGILLWRSAFFRRGASRCSCCCRWCCSLGSPRICKPSGIEELFMSPNMVANKTKLLSLSHPSQN